MNVGAQMIFVRPFVVGSEKGPSIFFLSNQRVDEPDHQDRDIELLQKIAARDRAAFAEFYDRHATLMFSVASRILNNPTEAEDVLQEVFLQIWEKAEKFDPKLGRASSWAAILVRNKAIDRVRASQRRTRLAEAAGLAQNAGAETTGTTNNLLSGREETHLIQSAIIGLPSEQRQAIELAYFSGLTQNEISEKLNEPLGTIKARIRRGLSKMRDQLEGRL